MDLMLKKIPVCSLLLLISTEINAGAYFFADENNGVDLVVHPSTYMGSGGEVLVRVCIDPESIDATELEYSVQNIINTYNQMLPTTDNLKSGSGNNVPSGYIDFESVALHEVGHCLGMAHINAASESGLTGNQQNYSKATDGIDNVFNLNAGADGVIGSSDDVRGDDVNLVWFRRSNNDPFTIDTVIDSTTYSRDTVDLPAEHLFAANADRTVSTSLGYIKTEAVMQQLTYFDEAQRTLGHDDVATLRYASSGINEIESGGQNSRDNYNIVLEYGGISTTNCDMSMSITTTPGLAFCAASGQGIATNHVRMVTPTMEFGSGFNWFFNAPNTSPVLNAIGNIDLLDGDNLVVSISATDVDANTLSFSVSGLPSFATFVDNNDGTATLTVAPAVGEDSLTSVMVTVMDDGVPVLSVSETFDIDVSLDSDGDGLSDDDEIIYGTLPGNPDSDADGLSDGDEILIYSTSPNNADSDGDFINDGDEVVNGTDPLDVLSWPNFADGDMAPLGSPDGLINAADFLIAQRIVLGELSATSLELAHGDLYPAGSPDGVINAADLILILKLVQ